MKISIPTIELTQEEWDRACELLKAEYGYTTRAECREHFRNDVRVHADHLAAKWSENYEEYGSL